MASDTDLLTALFASATASDDVTGPAITQPETTPWFGFLTTLGTALRADSARLQVLAKGRITRNWLALTAPADAARPAPADTDAPPVETLQRMRNDRVYTQADLPGAGADTAPLRALRAAAGPQGLAVLTLRRGTRDFRATDTVQLSHLGPYLGQAVAAWETLQRERDRAAQDRRLTLAAGVSWLRLSPSGRVIDLSPALRNRFEDQLGHAAGLRLLPTGWLTIDDPAAAIALRRGLVVAQGGGAAVIDLEPGVQLLLSPDDRTAYADLRGVLRQSPSARAIDTDRVAKHFGLSHSEARLTQLICDGVSLKDAAVALGWTLETTRSCSKQVFQRMGVKGQTGVLRKVWASTVWFAEGNQRH